jgi:hypothetical protein
VPFGVAVKMEGADVPVRASAVCDAITSRSLILPGVVVVIGVVNRLFESIGVFVTAGGVEYGCSQADNRIAARSKVEAMIKPRFVRDMDISSISNKSFRDGSTSTGGRQVSRWEIVWIKQGIYPCRFGLTA